MSKKKDDLFNESINEFTDWVSGDNSLTNGNDTGNLPVSGERIRELLLNRLKEPIYIWRDTTENLYRIFSSIEAWRVWDSDRTKYSKLEIANFVAPSEYGITVKMVNTDTIIYAREGVHDENFIVAYSWEVKDGKGNELDENMYITYDIVENGGHYPTTKTPNLKNVREDLYEWLSPGTNTVKISFKGAESGAEISKTIVVHVLKFNVTTDFDYTVVQRNMSTLNFAMYADRNVKGPLTFKTCRYYYGTLGFNTNVLEQYSNDFNISAPEENNYTPSLEYQERGTSDKVQLKAGLHTMLIWGQMNLNNQVFNSNLLYYAFGVGFETGDVRMFHGISFEYSFNNRISFVGPEEFLITGTLYEPINLNWGYISYGGGTSRNISWYLRNENESDSEDYSEIYINTYTALPNVPATPLQYIPVTATELGRKTYFVAKINDVEYIRIPVYIEESELGISETGGVDLKLKLSAYGKQNNNPDATSWTYSPYETTFTGLKWNEASGWYNNSLRISGSESNASINYNPFYDLDMVNKGATIEIEFESEYVSSTDEELVRLGSALNNEPHISIFANKAQLFIGGNPIITTNYKANERVKLAFIIEPSSVPTNSSIESVIFIVNNGIVERAAGWKGYNASSFTCNSGSIKIGGCNSGVRVYNIRCYTKAITTLNAYNNYVYDSDNKALIVANNDIYVNGEINLTKCLDKLDVIILTGNLNKVLSRDTTKSGSNSACDIQRICAKDHSKDFTCTHGRIRKHGLSTLNYPLTSYKLWTWGSVDEVRPTLTIGSLTDLPFSKNRYLMKDNSIPANKFVLQANYADSSGVHNGGFLQLIQDIWYNSQIDGEYKLRTQPLLFTSNQTISVLTGDSLSEQEERLFRGMNAQGKLWKDYFGSAPFPYTIRNSADSFPCLVFYLNLDNDETYPNFLGQYVFMDDKKSDYTYGERSIYKVTNSLSGTDNVQDPFCVKRDPRTGESVWDEKNGIRIWDNDKVLRIEVLSVNSTLSDYRGNKADNSGRFLDDVIYGTTDETTSIGWEEDFELVYPEKEEITTNKVFDALKFVSIVNPFTLWLKWLIGTYQNLADFEATAAHHLDLYKLAAYYIFVLRFGLVDSLERNAQIKTYDGLHFHYEPWDMDIALGNRNTGGIAFDPPIDRSTMMDANTGAISGRSWDANNNRFVSNWLFDALEAWPYWMEEIVPKVADAMFKLGLTYLNVINVLERLYQDAWCESIYNESGNFKYVVNRLNETGDGYDDGWLAWLQGARTTHRHWWLKSSMDYYDAKWGVGEFTLKNMYIGCEMHNVLGYINVIPTASTFFLFERESTKFGPYAADPINPLHFDVSGINSGAKVPFKLYGANFIKEIDISDIADGLQVFSVANAYSSEVGPIITKVDIGVPLTEITAGEEYTGPENNKELQISAGNALDAIEELNIRGQHSGGTNGTGRIVGLDFLANTKTIKKIYAMGSGMYTLTSAIGTDYEILELPDTLSSITFNSTTWDTSGLSFWITQEGGSTIIHHPDETDEDDNIIVEAWDEIVMEPATYTKFDLLDNNITTSIPRSLLSVSFTGTTGRYECARQFVVDWINSIIAWGTQDWTDDVSLHSEYDTLQDYLDHLFNERSLSVLNIYWDNDTQNGGIAGLSYEQLEYISKFNNIDYSLTYVLHPNVRNFSKGYVVLTDNDIITGIQATQLSQWFGEEVFTLNGNGLVVDHKRATNYNAISVGPDAWIENGEIYLKEGSTARISYTLFNLRPSLSVTDFTIGAPNSLLTSTNYRECHIKSTTIGEDTIYYLLANPYELGEDYDIWLWVGGSYVVVHIKATEYPEEIFLSAGGCKKTADEGMLTSMWRYNKSFDKFIFGGQTGNVLVGVQFKDDGDWVNSPKNSALTPQYVKFKVYKDGVLCSKFNPNGLDYNEFTLGTQTELEAVDSSDTTLYFTRGYRPTGDTYKYYIPLYILGTVTENPVFYTVECTMKIGGMTKTLTQDIILIRDFIVAPEGNPLWGLLNFAYVLQTTNDDPNERFNPDNYYSSGSFYRSITNFLTGHICVGGQYNLNGTWIPAGLNLQSLIYNGECILQYLPNITGIITDNVLIPAFVDDIPAFDFSTNTKLKKLTVRYCPSLYTQATVGHAAFTTIDLTNFPDIEYVDTYGTLFNVILPDNSKITTLIYGSPDTIIIDSPTVLTPAGITIQSTENLDTLYLENIPNAKTYTTSDKFITLSGISSPLPAGYTQLEYIASTSSGSLYIDTGVKLYDTLNPDYDYEIKFKFIGKGSDNSNLATLINMFSPTNSNCGSYLRRNNDDSLNIRRSNNGDAWIGYSVNVITIINNVSYYGYNTRNTTHNLNTSLFAAINADSSVDKFCEALVFYFKLWKGNQLVRDMIAAKNSSNVVGLYDLVSNTFYSSPNGAAFVAGPEVN